MSAELVDTPSSVGTNRQRSNNNAVHGLAIV